MNRAVVVPLAIFVASVFGGVALRIGGEGTFAWTMSRASGLIAFALLSSSVVFGLFLSTKAADGFVSRAMAFAVHQFLSILTITFIGIHGGALLFDGFFHFGPVELLVPFTSPYRPLWVGLGVISAWLTCIVTASFWVRTTIGQKAWRKLHYASFGAYALSLVHGITSGTDRAIPLVMMLYITSALLVAGLLAYRIANRRPGRARPATGRRAAPARAS